MLMRCHLECSPGRHSCSGVRPNSSIALSVHRTATEAKRFELAKSVPNSIVPVLMSEGSTSPWTTAFTKFAAPSAEGDPGGSVAHALTPLQVWPQESCRVGLANRRAPSRPSPGRALASAYHAGLLRRRPGVYESASCGCPERRDGRVSGGRLSVEPG